LKLGTSSGLDKIITELFIYGVNILVPSLTKLFNCVLLSSLYPVEWANGVMQLIRKKGDPDDPNNYRDITLLSCMGKLFVKVLYNRMVKWKNHNSILCEEEVFFFH